MTIGYAPYGGFRKAPVKFTSKLVQRGEEIEENDGGGRWFCPCGALNHCTKEEFLTFAFPSYPYMAIRDDPFAEVRRICWECGHQWINKTIEGVKKELE